MLVGRCRAEPAAGDDNSNTDRPAAASQAASLKREVGSIKQLILARRCADRR